LVSAYIGIVVDASGHNHENSKTDVFFDGTSIPSTNNCFDSVVCFEVLEHLEDPTTILEEINRAIKDHGSILISVSFLFGEHEEPYEFQRFKSFGLVKLLNNLIANRRKKLSFAERVAKTNSLWALEHL